MPDIKEELLRPRTVACLLLAVLALVSALWLADVCSSPETYQKSIAALDEKKTTVMELTAATAVASVAISAVPGDSTTPIADQVAELGSYLLIVTGVLMLEKFLLTTLGLAAFGVLIPAACLFGILHLLVPRALFKSLALRLGALGLVLFAVIPASVRVSELFEETFELQKTVRAAAQAADALEGEGDPDAEDADKTAPGSLGDWFADLGEQITGGVSAAVDKAEAALSNFIDAVAVLLISNCVIPVLVLLMMLWLLKLLVALPVGGGPAKPPALPAHKAALEKEQQI